MVLLGKIKQRSFHQQAIILHLLNKALSPKSLWQEGLFLKLFNCWIINKIHTS